MKTNTPTIEHKVAPIYITGIDEAQGIVDAIVNVFGILDEGDDVVQPGAFVKTITERASKIRVLDSHNARSVNNIVGKMLAIREIGKSELPPEILSAYPEATGGLMTRTQYLLDTPEGAGVFKRIASGAADEYSIGFDAVKTSYAKMTRKDGSAVNARSLDEVRLWEYSPVVWGMNPATATTGVKSADEPADTDDQPTQPLQPPTEAKGRRTIASYLTQEILSVTNVAKWLIADNTISMDEYSLISNLLTQAAQMVTGGLPEDLANRPPYQDEYGMMSADEPGEVKVGRVLSARNYGRIKTAYDNLTEVMGDADMMENADGGKSLDIAEREGATGSEAEPGNSPLTSTAQEKARKEYEALKALQEMWQHEYQES